MLENSTVVYTAITAFGAAVGLVVTAAYTWFIHPELVIKAALRYAIYNAGFKTKYVPVGRHVYCYSEKGSRSKNKCSMLFVHGFSASKDMWIESVKKLPSDIHCVLVDLPGHGSTTIPDPDYSVSLDTAIHDLHTFVEAIELNKSPFHLIGISLGGAISQNYAVEYPQDIERLTLICPAMRTPVETDFHREISSGHCMLIVDNIDDLRSLFKRVAYTKLNFSNTTLKGLLRMRLPRNEYMTRLFLEIQKLDGGREGREYEEKAALIKAPTQIIWGKQDELLHVSGADLIKSRIPNCEQVDLLDDCGHSCNIDRPGLVTKCLLTFRGELLHKKQS